MMISLKCFDVNQDQLDKLHDLVRASVVDIIRGDEVQDLIDEGILSQISDVYEIQDLSEEILTRATNYIKEKNVEHINIINKKIADEELKKLPGINNKMLALLATNDICTLDDFAGLATFDLLDKEEGIFRELDMEEKIVNDMIMKAREKWFKEEE